MYELLHKRFFLYKLTLATERRQRIEANSVELPQLEGEGKIKLCVNDTHILVYYPPDYRSKGQFPSVGIYNDRVDNIANLLRSAFGRIETCVIADKDSDPVVVTIQCAHPAWGNGSIPFRFRSKHSKEAVALDNE